MTIVLEPAAQALADATAKPPFLYELSSGDARKVLDELQAGPIDKPAIDEEWVVVPAAVGDVRVPSPEARYPVAIEQGYATAQWITREGPGQGLDPTRMAIAGESVGGNMTAALALMAKERGDEGEAYAAKLRAAGVSVTTVRYDGTVHDFVLLDSLSQTRAARAATTQAVAFLRASLGTG